MIAKVEGYNYEFGHANVTGLVDDYKLEEPEKFIAYYRDYLAPKSMLFNYRCSITPAFRDITSPPMSDSCIVSLQLMCTASGNSLQSILYILVKAKPSAL
jgi:hypothetical protein